VKKFPYKKDLIGSRITGQYRTCDLAGFEFTLSSGKKLALHSFCFIRFFDSEILLLVTNNMYGPKSTIAEEDRGNFKWDEPGESLFDEVFEKYQEKLFSTKVKKVTFKNNDLRLYFENGMLLEFLADTTKYDDHNCCENFRIFERYGKHFVVDFFGGSFSGQEEINDGGTNE